MQFVHSFEKHEHLICNEQNKLHFDTHEIDCSVFHFKINTNTIDFSSKELNTTIVFIEEILISVEHQISSENIQHKSPRAPPYLLM